VRGGASASPLTPHPLPLTPYPSHLTPYPSHLTPHTSRFSPHAARLAVALLLLGATAAVSASVDFGERVPIAQPLAGFPLQLGAWQGRAGRLGPEYLDALDLTDYALVAYRDPAGRSVDFYVAYYASQRKGESIHSPETCLPGSGWVFREARTVAVPTPGYRGGALPVTRALLEKAGERQLAYFWFPARGRVLTNAWELKLYTFWDALTRQRTDGALVRLITPVAAAETVLDAEARLQGFAQRAAPVLDGFLPGG